MNHGPAHATIPALTRRSILLLSFATFSSMAAQRICDAMLPELSRVFSVSLSQAAHVVSMFAVVYGVSQLFYGPLGDRLGKYRIVTFATLACSLGSLATVFVPSLDLLVVARIFVGLAAGGVIPLAMAWVGDAVSNDHMQETLARAGMGTTLGIVGGQLMGGLLTDTLGWRWAFGFMAVLFGTVGLLLLKNWGRLQADPATAWPRPAVAASASVPSRPGFLKQSLSIIVGPWSRIVLVTGVIEGGAGFGVLAIWASHLHAVHGLSLSAAGAIVALFGLGGMLYMGFARHLIRLLGESGLAGCGAALMCAAAVVLGFSPWWQLTIPASLLGGFGFFMFHNTMQVSAAQMTPGARGTAVALFASSMFMGQSIGVLVATYLADRIGSARTIALGGAVVMLAGLWFASRLRQRELARRLQSATLARP